MSDPSLGAALWETAIAIGQAGATAATQTNDALADHPQVRTTLIIAAATITLIWFIDGIWNERRKCIPCKGRGSFTSKLSSRLDRTCKCCSGTGRHPTIRKRLIQQLRRSDT